MRASGVDATTWRGGIGPLCAAAVLAAGLLAAVPGNASAQQNGAQAGAQAPGTTVNTLKQALDGLAKRIKDHMQRAGGSLAEVREFKDQSEETIRGASGAEIQLQLTSALKAHGVEPDDNGKWIVMGAFVCTADGDKVDILLEGMLADSSRSPPVIKKRFPTSRLVKLDEILRLSAISFDATPDNPDGTPGKPDGTPGKPAPPQAAVEAGDRIKAAAAAVKAPTLTVEPNIAGEKTLVAPKKNSPFGVEVCRLQNGQPVPVQAFPVEGGVTVHVGKDESFIVRLHNGADFPVGVKLYLDGISMFEFSEIPQFKAQQIVYVEKGTTALIRGWHLNNKDSMAFTIVDLPNAAAALIPAGQRKPDRIGTVTAEFFPAWTPNHPRPAVAAKGPGVPGVGVGLGPVIGAKFNLVPATFDEFPLAAVTVRYQAPPPVDLKELPPAE